MKSSVDFAISATKNLLENAIIDIANKSFTGPDGYDYVSMEVVATVLHEKLKVLDYAEKTDGIM